MAAYCLDEFYNVLKNAPLYPLGPDIVGVLDNLNAQIAPLFVEKNERKGEPSGRKRRQPQSSKANDNWEEIRTTFKPTTVVEEKQEGIVRIAFTMDRQGNVLNRQVDTSSGYPYLDAAALKMFDDANPLPPVPDDFAPGRMELPLVMPIDFTLITNTSFGD